MRLVKAKKETSGITRKGPEALLLGRTAKTVDSKAASFATQLYRWMQRFARAEARRQRDVVLASSITKSVLAKAEPPSQEQLERELRRILVANGKASFTSSVRRTLGVRDATPADAEMQRFMASKEIRIQQIMSGTRKAVTDSIRQIILTALAEDPRPSTTEIGRRIGRVYHGDTGGEVGDIVPAPLTGSRVLPTERVRLTGGGNLYVFSFERAQLIARTEMAQAENEGIVEGYRQAGVPGLKWLAYNDGRTGDREHNEMNKHPPIAVGERFTLPDGTRMRFPGDPTAPIKHLANCRCTVRAVRRI